MVFSKGCCQSRAVAGAGKTKTLTEGVCAPKLDEGTLRGIGHAIECLVKIGILGKVGGARAATARGRVARVAFSRVGGRGRGRAGGFAVVPRNDDADSSTDGC